MSRVLQGHSLLAFELWCWKRLLRVPWMAKRSNQSILKEISLNIHWKDWCWSWNSNTLASWYEELTHWKRLWCGERLKAGGEGDDRGWDGWMAWVSSGSWWWTGRPGVLQSMGSQRVGHDWMNWTELLIGYLVQESEGRVTHSQLSRLPRVFWKGNFVGVGSLLLYPLSLLVAVSYNWQCVYSYESLLNWMPWQSTV